jgi:hypothetical protein
MDLVVYLVLVAGACIYAFVIAKAIASRTDGHGGKSTEFNGKPTPTGQFVASRFRRYSILLLSYVLLVGVMYQAGTIPVSIAAVLFVPGAIALFMGLMWLRRYIH